MSRLATVAVATVATLTSALPAHAETVDETLVDALTTTNAYWSDAFPTYWNTQFDQPVYNDYGFGRNGLYDSGTSPNLPCGPYTLQVNNAHACDVAGTNNDFTAYDLGLMNRAANEGDGLVWLVVAHEYGHLVQFQLNDQNVGYSPRKYELQADCWAGAALAGMVAQGQAVMDQGDMDEVLAFYRSTRGLPWGTDPTDTHGSPQERTNYFTQGWNGGGDPNSCLQDPYPSSAGPTMGTMGGLW